MNPARTQMKQIIEREAPLEPTAALTEAGGKPVSLDDVTRCIIRKHPVAFALFGAVAQQTIKEGQDEHQ